VKVFTARMYYKYGYGAIDYEQVAESISIEGAFELKLITEPGVTKGREWCMKELEKRKNKK